MNENRIKILNSNNNNKRIVISQLINNYLMQGLSYTDSLILAYKDYYTYEFIFENMYMYNC